MRISGPKLAYHLADQEITLTKLSAKAGVSRGTLSMIKSGKRCSDETGLKIAEALGVKPEDLLEK